MSPRQINILSEEVVRGEATKNSFNTWKRESMGFNAALDPVFPYLSTTPGRVTLVSLTLFVLIKSCFTFGRVNVLQFLDSTVFNSKPREEWGLSSTLHRCSGIVINI